MLHITNGDNANQVLQHAGVSGRFLSWADVLHDGPVPAGLTLDEMSQVRANFIHHCGWASEFEALTHFQSRDAVFLSSAREGGVVIWNSPELYDQLHLIQLLSWYNSEAGRHCQPPELVLVPFLLGLATEEHDLPECLNQRQVVSTEQLQVAEEAWYALTASNPRMLAAMLKQDLSCLPYLKSGLQRLAEEYPDLNGINRTERQILSILSGGESAPGSVFKGSQQLENPQFMGDSSFWLVVKRMVESDRPLIALADGTAFKLPGMFGADEAFLQQQLLITDLGAEVLEGDANWLAQRQIDRWVGGVHLNPENIWCWGAENAEFVRV
ncbi:MAG: hypothetical protein KC477_06100 [Oceanospirillaceae bacterium]|nr:hypothetical protein [Oceanospirillaceae bacterium]